MDTLPTAITQHIYEYDSTYKVKFDKYVTADEDALLYL